MVLSDMRIVVELRYLTVESNSRILSRAAWGGIPSFSSCQLVKEKIRNDETVIVESHQTAAVR